MALPSTPEPRWQELIKGNFTNWAQLVDFLQLSKEQAHQVLQHSRFPLNLPRRLAEKIQPGCLEDPILLQFVPTIAELVKDPRFVEDPVKDTSFTQQESRLLQKYGGRALLLTTKACVMNCRFCFRQHYPYQPQERAYTEELELIAQDPTIKEVILSGGDPLSLANQRLQPLLHALSQIDHVKLVRFHTRFPVGIPERIDSTFLQIVKETPLQFWFVLHTNHPLELDDDVITAMQRLQGAGVPVLTQTVLLRGVNDDVETLRALFERLVYAGLRPYYLHQLDPVAGGGHFEVTRKEGLRLMEQLRQQLPGYALPRYVEEIPGETSKTVVKS